MGELPDRGGPAFPKRLISTVGASSVSTTSGRAEMLKAEPNAAHRAIAGSGTRFRRPGHHPECRQSARKGGFDAYASPARGTYQTSFDGRSVAHPAVRRRRAGFSTTALPTVRCARPHIGLFGEPVPGIRPCGGTCRRGPTSLMVVGTSLAVYPAASLVRCVRPDIPVYVVDPGRPAIRGRATIRWR